MKVLVGIFAVVGIVAIFAILTALALSLWGGLEMDRACNNDQDYWPAIYRLFKH